jgi:hypothetical protein
MAFAPLPGAREKARRLGAVRMNPPDRQIRPRREMDDLGRSAPAFAASAVPHRHQHIAIACDEAADGLIARIGLGPGAIEHEGLRAGGEAAKIIDAVGKVGFVNFGRERQRHEQAVAEPERLRRDQPVRALGQRREEAQFDRDLARLAPPIGGFGLRVPPERFGLDTNQIQHRSNLDA